MPLPVHRHLFAPGDRVLIALSGGPDSLALAHWLAGHRRELAVELRACHVHHGMRGARADQDCEFLLEWGAQHGIPLHVVRTSVPDLAAERRISVEEAGRLARYQAFARIARETGCGKVATAHTADDQAETVLFRLLRGTGTNGLAGIPERRPLSQAAGAPEVVRPLLGAWRSDIEAYVREHGLQPLDDATNRDTRYRRSRIRLELLPSLLAVAPGFKRSLVRLSQQAASEGAFLDRLASELLQQAAVPEDSGWPWARLDRSLVLDAAELRRADPVLVRRALRLALRRVGGYDVQVDRALLERVEAVLRGELPAVEAAGAPLTVRAGGNRLRFQTGSPISPRGPLSIAAPGETSAPEWGVRVVIQPSPPPQDPRRGALAAILDEAAVAPPLRLRVPARGDRFHPLNAPGGRLLSDLFLDRRIPAAERTGWPVLEDAEGILWVPGVATAHRARVRPETWSCWEVSLVPEAP